MGTRPVSAQDASPSWRLLPPHDRLTQGLVVSGFGSLPTGRALFLEFGWRGAKAAGGGEWLRALREVAPVTDADGREPRAAALAFTWAGLAKMGLTANALASFDQPFREGMFQQDRLRRLGDRRGEEWLHTVIDGGPRWSGNTPPDPAAEDHETRPFDDSGQDPAGTRITTPLTVHALLLLYEKDEETAAAWCAAAEAALAPHGVKIVHRLELELRPDEQGIAREHFGFADGVSQPVPFGEPVAMKHGPLAPETAKWNGVPLGEILLGHANAHHEVAPGPVVADSPQGRAAGLRPHPRAEGFLDLGLDGSYMVVRELRQDVAAFWNSMDAAAAASGASADWLAERVVGRTRDGALLCPAGTAPPGSNDFGYAHDPHGLGCPLGSHVRRGNPRDTLAPTEQDRDTLRESSNSHRLLRRGRKFGRDIADPRVDDGQERGLLFIALNSDIARQFEFVQQTWVLNRNFATLYDQADPLIGPRGGFTIPEEPLRRIVEVDTFVQMAGGEYFFLPGMAALRFLEAL